MPHDMKGREVKVGDIVNVPMRVKSVSPCEEACNCCVETLDEMFGSAGYKPSFTINTRQAEVVSSAEPPVPEGAEVTD